MKKYIILLLLVITSLIASAQYIAPISTIEVKQIAKFDSCAILPNGYAPQFTGLDSARRWWFDPTTKTVWYHNGTKRVEIANAKPNDTGNLYFGQIIAPGLPFLINNNGVLYSNIANQLESDAVHFGYIDALSHLFYKSFPGDTLFNFNGDTTGSKLSGNYFGARSTAVGGKFMLDKTHAIEDTIDVSNLTASVNQKVQNKNGTFAYMDDRQNTYIFKVQDVNMQNATATTIGTTSASNGRFIVTNIRLVMKNFTGTVLTQPVISIGNTGAAYADIVGLDTLTATPTINNQQSLTILSTALTTNISTAIKINVSTAATFTTTGVYTVDVYVQGYYETL